MQHANWQGYLIVVAIGVAAAGPDLWFWSRFSTIRTWCAWAFLGHPERPAVGARIHCTRCSARGREEVTSMSRCMRSGLYVGRSTSADVTP
jgi:hypothetical protein